MKTKLILNIATLLGVIGFGAPVVTSRAESTVEMQRTTRIAPDTIYISIRLAEVDATTFVDILNSQVPDILINAEIDLSTNAKITLTEEHISLHELLDRASPVLAVKWEFDRDNMCINIFSAQFEQRPGYPYTRIIEKFSAAGKNKQLLFGRLVDSKEFPTMWEAGNLDKEHPIHGSVENQKVRKILNWIVRQDGGRQYWRMQWRPAPAGIASFIFKSKVTTMGLP